MKEKEPYIVYYESDLVKDFEQTAEYFIDYLKYEGQLYFEIDKESVYRGMYSCQSKFNIEELLLEIFSNNPKIDKILIVMEYKQ